jgi:hypothetical protein
VEQFSPLSTSCIGDPTPCKKRRAPLLPTLRVAFLEVISAAGLGQDYPQYSDNQVGASPMLPSGARVSVLQMMGTGYCYQNDACRQLRRGQLAEVA